MREGGRGGRTKEKKGSREGGLEERREGEREGGKKEGRVVREE